MQRLRPAECAPSGTGAVHRADPCTGLRSPPVRIPSGDLAPARRRRRHAFGRRRSRTVPLLLALLLLAGLTGGAFLLRRGGDGGDDNGERLASGPCGTPAPAALRLVSSRRTAAQPVAQALPAPAAVRLRLFNGTARDGLARTVGEALAARGFAVLSTVNAPGPLPGRSQVRFGPGGRPGATLLSAHVSGSTIVPVPGAPRGSVELVLGSAFVRLRTPAEVTAALRAPARSVAARPAPARTAPVPTASSVPEPC